MKNILLFLLQIQLHILQFIKAQEWNMGYSFHYLMKNPSLTSSHPISFQEESASSSQAQIYYVLLVLAQVLKVPLNEA